MDLKKLGGNGVDWIDLARHRVQPMVDGCEHGNKPSGSIKGEEFLD
jgi:hypothetical protein